MFSYQMAILPTTGGVLLYVAPDQSIREYTFYSPSVRREAKGLSELLRFFSRCLLPPRGRAREVRGLIAYGHRLHRKLGRDYASSFELTWDQTVNTSGQVFNLNMNSAFKCVSIS